MEIRNERNLWNLGLLVLGVFAAYTIRKSIRQMFWAAFGIGWVVYWTGGWPFSIWF